MAIQLPRAVLAAAVLHAALGAALSAAATSPAATPHRQASWTPSPTPTPTPLPTALALGDRAAPAGIAAITGDCDGNGRVTIDELVRGVNIALGLQPLSRCPDFDANRDGRVTIDELVRAVNIALNGLPPTPTPTLTVGLVRLVGSSPAHGEDGVAVTRETVLRFSAALDPASVVHEAVHAEFAGAELLARIHLSPDRRTVTLFYDVTLPPNARIRVTVDGTALRGANGNAVDADSDGRPGGVAHIDFDTLSVAVVPGTIVCGRVFASELVPGQSGQSMNVPLAGVLIEVDGDPSLRAVTDQFGNFRLDPAPAGRFFVYIVGSGATNNVPPGAYYPNVGKAWTSVAGQEINVGDIFLPLIRAGTLRPVSQTTDTVIGFPDDVIRDFPELTGVRITVPADALFSDRGQRGGMVGIAPVAPDRIPSPLPPGLQFPLVITVQTDGAQNFDRPVPVCFPNLPDPRTGRALAPGADSALWSFDHDTGEWEVVGAMRVSADGRLVCSVPGSGILAPGWHGTAPGAAGSGGPLGGPPADDDTEKGGDDPPPGNPDGEQCPRADGGDGDAHVDPVYLFSGEFYESVDDLRIRGRGLDFVWSRKYRSKIGPNTVQGNGWDFSYNISLIPDGADLVACDGRSRRDRYGLLGFTTGGAGAVTAGASFTLPGRTWTHPEQFNELTQNEDGTFTMLFPGGGSWLFEPLDDRPARGKIRAITDRNGNTLRFAYDSLGRLTRITDTLDRDIAVAYNAEGFIESVTDFSGRQVRYTYYADGDTGGGRGDLKSVRSPVVSGTPNRNDFPDGQRTTYTYTTGFADDRLNHNLLTITDGRRNDPSDPTFGQGPYLVNEYAATTDPEDLEFDRIVRQRWGGANDLIDIAYVPQAPSAANGFAYIKAIVNDRVGNVTEYAFERGNRVVSRREYTGRANPARRTTETANRPANRLRPDDPPFFETRYAWNDAAQMTRVVYPNGNSVEYAYAADLDRNAPARQRGNLRRVRRIAGPLAGRSDQAEIVETYEYDDRFGCGRCAGRFVTRAVDGRGAETLHAYDARGNRTRTTHRLKRIVEEWEYNEFGQVTAHTLPANGDGNRRRDELRYHASGPQRGYLERVIADARGLALTTRYEYDAVGNVVRHIDPRGHDTRYAVTALDQVVRETSREIRDGSGIRYQRDIAYDANRNVVRIDVQNVDDRGQVQANTHFTTSFDRELLNHVTRRREEVEATRSIATEYGYDANRNLTLTRFGEATSGRQPGNVRRVLYDERNLAFRVIAAEGTPEQSTTQYGYDGNRNVTAIAEGLEATPHVMTAAYDGFDRPIAVTDGMGNVRSVHYDGNGNITSGRLDGELEDLAGGAGNVRLLQIDGTFDEMDRLTVRDRQFFDPRTQAPLGDGTSTTRVEYSDTSQIVRVVDDNGRETRVTYDTANRGRTLTDAKGNSRIYGRDANDNVTQIELVEKSDLGRADQRFVFTRAFDNLDRLIRSVDSAGGAETVAYDSRSNPVVTTDATGNTTRFVYDGMNRLVEVTYLLTGEGAGGGTPIGSITTRRVWDDSSRLLRSIDGNGNETRVAYDARNRRTRVEYADGTARTATYDVHGNATVRTDANGSVVRSTFDANNRVVERVIERAAGVLGPTRETFGYDARGLLIAAGNDAAAVRREYDSLGNPTRQVLNDAAVASTYDGEGNQLSCAYAGGRRISTVYDELNRKRTVRDQNGLIASYAYIGPHRIEQRDLGNGTRAAVTYDGMRRVTRTTHTRIAGGTILDDRTYAWDPDHNKTSYSDARAGRGQALAYDSLHRLIRSVTSPPGGAAGTIAYTLDAAGNRTQVAGGVDAGSYTLSPATPEPADSQVNQYSGTPFDGRRYDANGNLVSIDLPPLGGTPEVRLAYDYRNRLVQLTDATTGMSARYAYDPLGRRVAAVVDDGTERTTRFVYDGWHEIEEQDAAGATQATYVTGQLLDEMLSMRRGAVDFFFHGDDRASVTAVTDAAGSVVERYQYDDYGRPRVLDPAGAPRAQSAIGNPWLFTGRRFDPESGFYYYRMRYLDPRTGRFITRDPIGAGLGPLTLGNAFTYVGNNPYSYNDPLGLFAGGIAGAAAADALISAGTGAATAGGSAGVAGGAAGATVGTAGSAAVGVAAGAVVVAGAAGVAIGTVINHFAEDSIQAGLDRVFGNEDMPDPHGGDVNANTEIDQPPVDEPQIDQEPIPDPDQPPAPQPGPPRRPGRCRPFSGAMFQCTVTCTFAPKPGCQGPCPPGGNFTGVGNGCQNACAAAQRLARQNMPSNCVANCT